MPLHVGQRVPRRGAGGGHHLPQLLPDGGARIDERSREAVAGARGVPAVRAARSMIPSEPTAPSRTTGAAGSEKVA